MYMGLWKEALPNFQSVGVGHVSLSPRELQPLQIEIMILPQFWIDN